MKITSKFHIKGRGLVYAVDELDREFFAVGSGLVRKSDGYFQLHRGLERYCLFVGQPRVTMRERKGVAFLMPDDCKLEIGDEVTVLDESEGLCMSCKAVYLRNIKCPLCRMLDFFRDPPRP